MSRPLAMAILSSLAFGAGFLMPDWRVNSALLALGGLLSNVAAYLGRRGAVEAPKLEPHCDEPPLGEGEQEARRQMIVKLTGGQRERAKENPSFVVGRPDDPGWPQ